VHTLPWRHDDEGLTVKLDGRIEIAAPARAVWDTIIDPVSLAGCVPGVQDVRRVDERTFEGQISASVGPMESAFAFSSTINRADFPTDLEVETSGTDTLTKSTLTATVHAALEEVDDATTRLVYRADVRISGRLAILGDMILRATAGVIIGEVAKCLRSRLEAPTPG
jgi:carbon monoxide dehydrogenase subunit G